MDLVNFILFMKKFSLCLLFGLITVQSVLAQKPAIQIAAKLVESMPNMPEPYKMKDWKHIVKKQDSLLYNFHAKGRFLPLIWWDDNKTNFPIRSFGIPSYVGALANESKKANYESLPVMGSIISATLVGFNKSNYDGNDFVTMCKQFYNTKNGVNLIMNSVDRIPGQTFWYEIFPGMAFSMLVNEYPENNDISDVMKLNATKWIEAIDGLSKGRKYPDFNYTSYNFNTKKGVYNGIWHEPDAAAGLAWLEFAAWKKFGDERFLKASQLCMEYLQNRPSKEGPFYELMMPYGAYLAVRLNAESGTHYDELKMLNWCFDGNNTDRDGWGVTTGKWGEYDIDGLVGQKKEEQYAFAMNTFSQAAALVPIVKYNPAYAKTIGKWILNLANASRLFYGDEHPKNQQSSAIWQGDPDHVICYEGLRKDLDHGNRFGVFKGILSEKGPYAIGDQVKDQTAFTDICPYGSAWVGMLAAIVDTTNVKGILQLDCNATDFYSSKKFKSYLLYNPYPGVKIIHFNTGEKKMNVYDRVTKMYLVKNANGIIDISLDGDTAMSLVLVPSGIKVEKKGPKLMADNIVVDFNIEGR